MPNRGNLLASPASIKCRRVGCENHACTASNGYDLPFCAADMRLLTLRTFRQLVVVAGRSVFDIDAVSEAAVIVAGARLELRTKLAKPPKAARKR
jgi:hypothetical protein